MIEFPQQLRNTKTSWNAIIKVSKYHYENGHLGLSVLAAWEAVMDRLAGIYQVDSRNIENYKRLGKVVRSHDFDRIYGQTLGFPSKMRSLSKFRNGIAHAEECQFSDIANEFPIILKLLERRLGDTSLDSLPNYVAWETI